MSHGKFDHWMKRRRLQDLILGAIAVEDVNEAMGHFRKRLRTGDAEALKMLFDAIPLKPDKTIEMMGAANSDGTVAFTVKIGERELDGDEESERNNGGIHTSPTLPETAGIRGFDEPVHDSGGIY